MATFKALLATKEDGKFACSIQQIPMESLPAGDALIRVAYSDLNYKDGLAVLGRPGVIRKFPMVPGIDMAGVVEESSAPEFPRGTEVAVIGAGLSETIWGGYAQYGRVPAECILPLPAGLSMHRAMAIGTAGFTAMQCVMALEEHGLEPDGRDVLVTGAAGGVGSCAVAILANRGYRVTAVTGRPELADYLKSLGAADIVDRAAVAEGAGRGLTSERWAGAVDTTGGPILAGLLPAMAREASVAACGLAASERLNTTVFPFILRGVNLLGINSLVISSARRRQVWTRVDQDLPARLIDSMTVTEPLEKILE
jgi:acrylyl-CoA reductase (NADPH)